MQPQLLKVISFRHRKLWKTKVHILNWKVPWATQVTGKILSVLCILLSLAETQTHVTIFSMQLLSYTALGLVLLLVVCALLPPTLILYWKQCPARLSARSSPLSAFILVDSIISELMDFEAHIHNSVSRRLIAPQFQPDWGGCQARDTVFLLSIGAFL